MDFFSHIYRDYAHIYPSDMAANDERLRSSYNAEEPLESLLERLYECVDLAVEAGELVLETQIVRIAYRLVAETGQYPEDCRVWRKQDEKSWTTFQAYCIEAQADLRERQKTSL